MNDVQNVDEVDPTVPLSETEEQALRDNSNYWDTKELAFAGRLKEEVEFFPGQTAAIHTLDNAEILVLGKILDREFGKVNQVIQGSSYNDGLRIVTLSLAMDSFNGEPLWVPVQQDDKAYDDDAVSIRLREAALERKSEAARRKLHSWFPEATYALYTHYLKLNERKDAAFKLLPFYSAAGEKFMT